MVAPLDFTRLKQEHNKKRGVKDGFNDPITWIDTGSYALNKMISGDFFKGVPLGSVTVFAGESGSAKSYIVSGNIVRNALAQGIYVVVLDTEDALKSKWMRNLLVDPEHANLVKYVKSTVNEIAEVIKDFTDDYRKNYENTPREEQPKILFVVDSLGFVETEAEIEQFEKGDLKGDKGIKAKMLKMLVANCIRLFAGYEIGLIATNHTYKSQSQFDPDDVISGGSGFIYAANIIVSMNKKKLKSEEHKEAAAKAKAEGKRRPPVDIVGITASIKCVKTRYSKPFEEVEINIPYETGMDPYSGLFKMLEDKGILARNGSWYTYIDTDGEEHKLQRKDMTSGFFQRVMREFPESDGPVGVDEIGMPDEDMADVG